MGNQNTDTAKCRGKLRFFCGRYCRMIVKAEGKEACVNLCPRLAPGALERCGQQYPVSHENPLAWTLRKWVGWG